MSYKNFTADGDHLFGDQPAQKLAVVADTVTRGSKTWGGGTLTFYIYDHGLAGYQAVESWTADFAQVITIGAGTKGKLTLSGATSPDIDVTLTPVYGN